MHQRTINAAALPGPGDLRIPGCGPDAIDDDAEIEATVAELMQNAAFIDAAFEADVLSDGLRDVGLIEQIEEWAEKKNPDGFDALSVVLRYPADSTEHRTALALLRGLIERHAYRATPQVSDRILDDQFEEQPDEGDSVGLGNWRF